MGGTFDYFWAPDEGVEVQDIRDLVPFVVEKAPGSDPTEVRRALAASVFRFLRETGCWEREVQCSVTTAGVVRVGAGGCARIRAVKSLRKSDETMPQYPSDQPWRTLAISAREDASGVFTVDLPQAEVGDIYYATVVLTTRLGSELCPVWVLERYGEAIAAHAAHSLALKGQVGTTTLSLMYREAVQDAIGRKATGGSALTSGVSSAISGSLERI